MDARAMRMNDERERRTTSFDWEKIITKVTNSWRTHTADVSTTLAVDVAFKPPATDVMISDKPDISEKGRSPSASPYFVPALRMPR
jgi:hypothetical protein